MLTVSFSIYSLAQNPVITYSGDLFFIPGAMTKDGKTYMVDVSNDRATLTVYDGNFNVVCKITDPTAGMLVSQRTVVMTCKYDGDLMEPITEWTVESDQTNEITRSSSIAHFELYSDNNDYHSRAVYVTQSLFDDDDEFEYLRQKVSVIPIDVKLSDYEKEHPRPNSGPTIEPSYGNDVIDRIIKETGADSFTTTWDEEREKMVFIIGKTETYGGTYTEGMEIVSSDGTVKSTLPGTNYISSAYYFRGKCYIQGYDTNGNKVLYQLGNKTTESLGMGGVAKQGDVNKDGVVSITDAVSVVNIILNDGNAPAAPALKEKTINEINK